MNVFNSLIELLPNVFEIKTKGRLSLANVKSLENKHSVDSTFEPQTMPSCKANNKDENEIEIENEINFMNIVNAQLNNLHDDSTSEFLETQAKIVEKWNKITPCIIEGQRVLVDRKSWITKNAKHVKYTSDTMGYPMYFIA